MWTKLCCGPRGGSAAHRRIVPLDRLVAHAAADGAVGDAAADEAEDREDDGCEDTAGRARPLAAAARGDAREPTPVGTFADWLEAAAAGAGE